MEGSVGADYAVGLEEEDVACGGELFVEPRLGEEFGYGVSIVEGYIRRENVYHEVIECNRSLDGGGLEVFGCFCEDVDGPVGTEN